MLGFGSLLKQTIINSINFEFETFWQRNKKYHIKNLCNDGLANEFHKPIIRKLKIGKEINDSNITGSNSRYKSFCSGAIEKIIKV